jgi:hypothetical protein
LLCCALKTRKKYETPCFHEFSRWSPGDPDYFDTWLLYNFYKLVMKRWAYFLFSSAITSFLSKKLDTFFGPDQRYRVFLHEISCWKFPLWLVLLSTCQKKPSSTLSSWFGVHVTKSQ